MHWAFRRREEKCRFPDVEYSEEFVYRIDHTLTASSGIVKSEDGTNDSVIMAMGPKLDLIEFMAEYGSAVVTAVETDEGGADIQTVRIIVNNRARSLVSLSLS